MLRVTSTISVQESELSEQFVRATGPGGQNVNKVSSAVQLRFNVVESESLPVDVRQRLVQIAGKRMTQDGVLIIDARRFRTQDKNRRDARVRLVELIRQAAHRPVRRIKTKPTAASKRRHLDNKRRKGHLKRQRGGKPGLDD